MLTNTCLILSLLKKSSSVKEDKAKDDNLLWELLQKKRKSISDSPVGADELLDVKTCSKKLLSKMIIHKPVTRSQSKRPHLQSSFINSGMLLGSSPSATTHKVVRGKRVTP